MEDFMEEDSNKYYNERLAEMPEPFLKKAVDHIRNLIPKEERLRIKSMVAKHGHNEWIHKVGDFGAHFGWGMAVRNSLRDAGLSDTSLPMGNWDDYYVSCVEIACDARKFPEKRA